MTISKSRLQQAVREARNGIYDTVKLQLADEHTTYKQIANANDISLATVQRIAGRAGVTRQVGPRSGKVKEKNDDQR